MSLWTEGNSIELFSSGEAYFEALGQAIDNAHEQVLFEVYIFSEDEIGIKIAYHLKAAAQRGVTTHLVLDGFGSAALSKEFIADLKQAGVHVRFFRPLSRWLTLGRQSLKRLHRKIVVIDSTVAFVGGMNIAADQTDRKSVDSRADFTVAVRGPLVDRIRINVTLLMARIARQWMRYFRLRGNHVNISQTKAGNVKAAFVVRDNIFFRRAIEQQYNLAFSMAKKSIVIANAYFIPGRRIRYSLLNAAKRGVRVIVLVQGKPDFRFVHLATQALYGEFLRGGIQIIEYQQKLLHGKVAVVDSQWSTVGSCNLDPMSLFLNLEANVLVDDHDFASVLEKKLFPMIAAGKIIRPDSLSLWDRILSQLALFSFRALATISGVLPSKRASF